MKKICLISILFLFIFLFGCSKKNNVGECEIKDYEGIKYVNYNPSNVALLYPSFADMWLSTNGNISIGVEDIITRGYASSLTIVGDGTGKTINMELLVKAKPDFVILSHDFPNHDSYAKSLKEYNINYAIFEYSSYDDYLNILKTFSKINKSNDAYELYGVKQKEKIDEIINKSKEEDKKKVLVLRALSTKVTALTSTNFVGEMVNNLNSINIADSNKEISLDLSIEAILKINPDIILIVPMGDESVAFKKAEELLNDSIWQNLDAIKNKKVYKMEKELFHYKPNTKWDEAYELLYQRIYN